MLFRSLLALLGLPPLRIAQLIGNAPASQGRHLGGGNIDWWSIDVDLARLAREYGGLAMIRDGSRDTFGNNQHTHVYLVGCPHMSPGALSDMAEVLRGGDGLVGDVPDDPRLAGAYVPGRTWSEGVVLMQARLREAAIDEKIQKAEARQAKWARWRKKSKAFVRRLRAKRDAA